MLGIRTGIWFTAAAFSLATIGDVEAREPRHKRPGSRKVKPRPTVKRKVAQRPKPRVVKPLRRTGKSLVKKPRRVKPRDTGQLRGLRAYLVSAPVEKLAGKHKDLLRSSKINELMTAAHGGKLTEHDVATFAQSVHPRLLQVFEKGAKLPQGYFLSVTRQAQLLDFFETSENPESTLRRIRRWKEGHSK